ncbi:hypothetical protein Tco_0722714 [Tanacetum coccineum]
MLFNLEGFSWETTTAFVINLKKIKPIPSPKVFLSLISLITFAPVIFGRFIRFIRVINLDRLIDNLCTVWIGSFHLHANKVGFERDHKPKQPSTFNKKDTRTEVPKAGIPCSMPLGIPRGSFASILKEGSPSLSNPGLQTHVIVLDDSCLKERDFSMSLMGKVKEVSSIPNLYIILSKEGFQSVKITYLGGLWVLIKLDFQD